MKLLLYCTKAKPYLNCDFGKDNHEEYSNEHFVYLANKKEECSNIVNGKIVAECDFEVEKLFIKYGEGWQTDTIKGTENIEKLSCINREQLYQYCKGNGYAIHIKNLKVFDKPYELGKALIYNFNTQYIVEKAPQNMMKVYNRAGECHILISIRPEWLCKILNGEKTIEVRKKVLKGMMK